MKKRITTSLFICFTFIGIAQEQSPESAAKKQPEIKQLPVENDQVFLHELGISNLHPANPIGKERLRKVKEFDFDRYRHLSSRTKIQVLNGPLLELYSLNEMEAIGKTIDSQIKTTISQKNATEMKHEVVPLIHLGWNNKIEYYPPEIESLMHK